MLADIGYKEIEVSFTSTLQADFDFIRRLIETPGAIPDDVWLQLVRPLTKDDPSTSGTEWAFECSPETFSDTEPSFVLQVCDAVKAAWGPSVENLIIFNLPTTGSKFPAPVTPSKTPVTKDLMRVLNEGSLKLESRGNGPISSLGNPLRGVDVNLDVHYYKEHAIVGCMAAGSSMKVWGVGIHEDASVYGHLAEVNLNGNVSNVNGST
ncbi:hypothetical protein M441DRAFT_46619 [Trichoderma asperellum CBS 433.97]|uniref:2-isopropylmalate synthase n=1 Tax=Trichoderma asperellum (strain ATCC 204424 / CBS 433.97 / NBRC 101777) TaxID=1042311 RepID=A0A2T3Z9H6_TRIA4|nr:hypothetical protein M441DRAFT_46619 [Trichoderma asperellum CBS 433.97]PTB41457.1 hypothetical protein M441DRAFT_46619 [Trichoderma asperellum CBS 433.97]